MKIIATPTMCHHTETSLRIATMRMPNVFSSAWRNSTTARMAMVAQGWIHVGSPERIEKNAEMEKAQPKPMPAVTAIWPRRLNHPVNQLQRAPLPPDSGASLAAQ